MKFKNFILIGLVLLPISFLSCSKFQINIRERTPSTNRITQLEQLFDQDTLPVITIEISSNRWNELLQYFDANSRSEEPVPADFIMVRNGKTNKIANCGFRLRGNTFSRARPERENGKPHNSLAPQWNHAHFKLNFDEYTNQESFYGLKGLNLKWFKEDLKRLR